MLGRAIIFTVLFQCCFAYISYLNESEYARMPALFHLDPYDACLHADHDSGVYCSVKFHLVTDQPSELYDIITNYSARYETHFNHSQLSYGICLTKTCKQFYTQNTTAGLGWVLEECLNESMWRDYKLKTRIHEDFTCETADKKIVLDTSDIIVAAVIAVIVILNIIGSLQEVYFSKKGSAFLACFSIPDNWRKLTVPAGAGPDPRLSRLKGVYGIKAITIGCVILCHSILPAVVDGDNLHYFEEAYQKFPIMGNGTIVVQSFFLLSGLVLVYNLLLEQEKRKHTWTSLPKTIANRWLRLTPTYMLVLAVVSTWMRHMGSGPLWQTLAVDEAQDCRRDWWLHLLYANNYVDHSHCMLHTWYIAADMQLYCVGALVYFLSSGRWRKLLMASLLLAGVVLPAAITYRYDLDGMLLLYPETGRNFFHNDWTFHSVYKRGHTNLAALIIGMSFAFLLYHMQNNETALQKVANRRLLFTLSFPAMLAATLLGSIFYRDAPRASIYVRAAFSGLVKPAFAASLGVLVLGMVLKLENRYRRILEWRGWAVPSRLSYCTYIVHLMIIRVLNGSRTTLVRLAFIFSLEALSSCLLMSFVAAFFLHILVEAPSNALVKLCLSGSAPRGQGANKQNNIALVGQAYQNDVKLAVRI